MMTGRTWKEFDVMVSTSTKVKLSTGWRKASMKLKQYQFKNTPSLSLRPDKLQSRFFTAVTSGQLKGRGFCSTFA